MPSSFGLISFWEATLRQKQGLFRLVKETNTIQYGNWKEIELMHECFPKPKRSTRFRTQKK